MKNYHEYPRVYMGCSDIASLILVGCTPTGVGVSGLRFGGDGTYHAYFVDEDAEIGTHYYEVARYTHWFRVYDDLGLQHTLAADEIIVYRAGEYGCVVQFVKKGENNGE